MKNKTILKILFGIFGASVLIGIIGGLVFIWMSQALGEKIVASAAVIGSPTLLIGLFLALAMVEDENSEDNCDKNAKGDLRS